MIVQGDCVALMAELPEASVDAIVTDPPYGLGFMGHEWDQPGFKIGKREGIPSGQRRASNPSPSGFDREGSGAKEAGRYDLSRTANQAFQMWCEAWAREALRVLKPGGHLLAFGGTRTYHRLACAIEDAGFEIRDCLAWLYGSGFPKSLDVSKQLDRQAGARREVVAPPRWGANRKPNAQTPGQSVALVSTHDGSGAIGPHPGETAPATPEAEQWQGWGTALKPAHEPIVLARKPLAGTVAQNVLEHGTGALNIDATRIGMSDDDREAARVPQPQDGTGAIYGFAHGTGRNGKVFEPAESGRWPANVLLDEQAAEMLDEQTGNLGVSSGRAAGDPDNGIYGTGLPRGDGRPTGFGDSGGASRFLYVAKASSAERNAGLDRFEEVDQRTVMGDGLSGPRPHTADDYEWKPKGVRNVHPTVKPIELMRWLVRLVTPPSGTVLDPFTGSGTTGCAATLEGFNFIGMEREAEYVKIAEARIQWWSKHPDGLEIVKGLEADRERRKIQDAGQLGMFS